MKRQLLALLLLAFAAGAAAAAEETAWDAQRPEFRFFTEKRHFTQETWDQLPAADREDALATVRDAAQQRQDAVHREYETAAARWDLQQARQLTDRYTAAEVRAVQIWVGPEHAQALGRKVSTVRAALAKAAGEGLNDADAAALQPYLQPQAITELRSLKAAEALRLQAAGQFSKHELPRKTVDATVAGVSGALSGDVNRNMAKAFDGNLAGGNADEAATAGKYALPKGALNGAVAGLSAQTGAFVAANTAAALGTPRTTSASTVKSAAPASLDEAGRAKSTAWTSDAYGITVKTAYGDKAFRDPTEAEAYIRTLPPSVIKEVKLYGHGSPGIQTVGPASYDAGSTAQLLKGKMVDGGLVQFVGCNTASIGDASLNPATGLSIAARRLLYFSVPYWSDRINGTPSEQAKQQWEKEWNADLARDTSIGLASNNNVIVCGYRTFGLVPGRLPVLTRILGTQEDTDPTLVIGKKVCYQNGREVPAP
ncbi:MAG: hypothetical protein NDI60_00970 [Elusimicrobiales bacterium]|nr:hypothetical protein [Elusimicrobiales bacterium]